jgi:hypothetical protein
MDAWWQALSGAGDLAFPVPWLLVGCPAGLGNNDISSAATAPYLRVAVSEALLPGAWCVRPASMPHQ